MAKVVINEPGAKRMVSGQEWLEMPDGTLGRYRNEIVIRKDDCDTVSLSSDSGWQSSAFVGKDTASVEILPPGFSITLIQEEVK